MSSDNETRDENVSVEEIIRDNQQEQNEKTLILWTDFENLTQYYIVDGDQRKFEGVIINMVLPAKVHEPDEEYAQREQAYADLCEELNTLLADVGKPLPEFPPKEDFTHVVRCGFVP